MVTPARPDHIALELEFMAILVMKKRVAEARGTAEGIEAAAVCETAAVDFFRDHLAWWVPAFAAGLQKRAGSGFYAALATVLGAFIPAERHRMGVAGSRISLGPPIVERPEEPMECAACVSG
jgi:TorA maturation chaperone TorD